MKYCICVALLAALLAGCSSVPNSSSSSSESSSVAAAAPTTAPTSTPVPATATPAPTVSPTPVPEQSSIEVVDGITYVNGILIANKTYSLPADYAPGVNEEAKAAFEQMKQAAATEGLNIYISSAFRSYEYQTKIYNNYVARDGQQQADTYSARPGHSEHQTGLAFDLNSIDDSFANTPESDWVAQHAHEYGFIIRYPADKESVTGFKYEPWHLRYLGVDTATKVYESGLCLEEYLDITSIYPQ